MFYDKFNDTKFFQIQNQKYILNLVLRRTINIDSHKTSFEKNDNFDITLHKFGTLVKGRGGVEPHFCTNTAQSRPPC